MEIEIASVKSKAVIVEAQVKALLQADIGNDALLTSWTFTREKETPQHFGSIIVSLKVYFKKEDEVLESTYILKHNPNLNEAFTVYVTMLFGKEIGFYEKLRPLLVSELLAIGLPELSTPRCLFTGSEEGREVIALEDVTSQGFLNFDRRKGMDVSHASLVLQELGRIHATSVLVKNKIGNDEMDIKYSFLMKTWWNYREGAEDMFLINMRGHLDIAASALQKLGCNDAAAKWLIALKGNILQMFQEQTKKSPPFDVLCHADCTINNFLFKYNPNKEVSQVMVIDFQMCFHASLAIDLVHFFFCCLEGPVRRENREVLLRTYFQAYTSVLKAAGETIPFSFQELLQEYQRKIVYGAIMAILVVPLLASEEGGLPDVESIVDDTSFVVKRQDTFLRSLVSNPVLRARFLDIFRDLADSGVITG